MAAKRANRFSSVVVIASHPVMLSVPVEWNPLRWGGGSSVSCVLTGQGVVTQTGLSMTHFLSHDIPELSS